MRLRKVVPLLLVVGVLVGVVRILVWHPLTLVVPGEDTHVAGVVHVHTVHSDGGGRVEDVASAAKRAGLDFVIITDHNTFGAKPFEGYIDGVLVIVGTEISTPSGHLLGLGLPEPTFRFAGDTQDTLNDISDLGGVAFVAHPTSPRQDFGWDAWEIPGAWGIEVLSGDTQWRDSGWAAALSASLLYPLNPTYALLRLVSTPTTLARWDSLLATRDVPAIAGSDSHSYIKLLEASGVQFPGYQSVFELMRNHVVLSAPLTGDPRADSAAVVDALAAGRSHIGLDGLAPASGFVFVADDGERRWTMGDTVTPHETLRLRAGGVLPPDSTVSLYKDGQLAARALNTVTWSDVEPGVYRVEVELPRWDFPWIISNPIYVFPFDAADRRAIAARAPTAEGPPTLTRLLDGFDTDSGFFVASDPSTTVREDMLDPHGGPTNGHAARLAFTLGTPSLQAASPFAALTSFGPRDLTGGRGLAVSIKADGIYRLQIQVRDSNPASADGTEWWFASIKTSTEWRQTTVSFDRFRTTDPATDGRLDLHEVEGLVFLVDIGTVPEGTRGTIWFDDLWLY